MNNRDEFRTIFRRLHPVKEYYRIYGAGPWVIYTYGPPEMKNGTYRGRPSNWSALIAFTWVGDRQLEIIQPLEGLNIYDEYAKKGIKTIQSGEFDGSSFFYLYKELTLGIMLEMCKTSVTMHREPDRRYPG